MIISHQDILITDEKISVEQLKMLCTRWFGDMVKIVVDIEKKWLGIGGELHADAEQLLIENGCDGKNIWGANFYPWHAPVQRIEFTALINIRPQQDNPAMEILDNEIKTKMKKVIKELLLGDDEELV